MSEISDALAPTRTRRKVSNHSKSTKWTHQDDNLLSSIMRENPNPNWADLVKSFEDKTATQISERWEKVLNPALVKGSWTREEDEMIIQFVKEYGTKNWTKLAASLPGRIGKQCRERWKNNLDPDVNKGKWTQEEDQILIELHEKMGNQWVKMTEYLPGRSDNNIKNRWNSTLKKQLESIQNGTPRRKRGRPPQSTLNHPKSADDVPKPPKFEEVISDIKLVSPVKSATPGMLSPFSSLKSPFNLPLSPMMKQNNDFITFPSWSPSGTSGFDVGYSGFSPNLFSPTFSENKPDSLNLLSPMFKK